MSWENLLVKHEKLGHGAYGQVYLGKLIGTSPGIAHFHAHEKATYTDCDVAVKMLPKFANDAAKTEFRHEIDLVSRGGGKD